MKESQPYGPGGIVWSYDNVATVPEIVAAFNSLSWREHTDHNWNTCGRDCPERSNWEPTAGTYINGVMLTVDMDYIMGYLIQAVDRESSICTYIAINQYHGRHPETGEIAHDYMVWQGPSHKFFDSPGHVLAISHWGLDAIQQMLDSWYARPD